jgi:chromosome partitioning protein
MSDSAISAPGVQVIVVANEKGGSGKSTIAFNVAIALVKAGYSVASIDLDTRQRSFTHYIDNRLASARRLGHELPTPEHICFGEDATELDAETACSELADTLDQLAGRCSHIVIDTAGHDQRLSRFAHGLADTLITPMNDSFVDLDVLATLNPGTLEITGLSGFGRAVEEARRIRTENGHPPTDWIVLRNRLSVLTSRNKRLVGETLTKLSEQIGFRFIEGLTERVVFRELYPKGLTVLDQLDEKTLGVRPTMSHVAAQLEVQAILRALMGGAAEAAPKTDAVAA